MIGKVICDLAPSPENNRNSEGAFVTLKDGRILFVYSRYNNEGGDDGAAADLYGMLSSDNGESFSEPFPVLTRERMNAENIMSVSFMRMANDDIGMFFLVKRDADQCLCYLTRSADEGLSWGEPVLCTQEKGYFVVNNDRIIRLRSGRLLVPAALHEAESDNINGVKRLRKLHPGKLYIFCSDDDGFTWRMLAGDISLPVNRHCSSGVQEPGLMELEDGRIWCWIRTDYGRQYQTFSIDGGESWSPMEPSQFTSAVSPLSMKRLADGRLLALWNPIPLYNGRQQHYAGAWTGARTPLVYALSSDDGETFGELHPVETQEDHGYCYTAVHPLDDGSVLLGYCAGGPEDGSTLFRLRIRKLYPEDLC